MRWMNRFILQYLCVVFHCARNLVFWFPIFCICSVDEDITWEFHNQGGRARSLSRQFFCMGVCAELLWIVIYCAKTRLDPGYQYGYQYLRGLGRRSPWIIQEYNLMDAIAIRSLTHTHTCERGYSCFTTMIWLKFVSMKRASLLRITSTDKTNIYIFYADFGRDYRVYLYFSSTIKSGYLHWLFPVSVCIRL